ncbi:MAG: GntR family transcriptional regulator [Spirochaetales bacterium]|nr:GntR family transcriptional regulator [Spirochaetales bacterium]
MSTKLSPKKKRTSVDVLEYIRDRILNFSLLPGVKISDDEVAKVFGISRSPVREALNRLVEQGLVEYRPNRGFAVRVFTRKDVEDYYILREALECVAVKLATASVGAHELKTLEDLLATYPAIIESGDIVRFNECDERFHDLIGYYSKNRAVYKALQNLQGIIRIIRRYDHIRSGSLQHTLEQHQVILRHMTEKNPKAAASAMSSHIRKSMQLVMPVLPQDSWSADLEIGARPH